MLAEAFAEPLTKERVVMYAGGLADIPKSDLEVSFQRALRELSYFPKVAELRKFAGAAADDEKKVEADAAWTFVNNYLREWGVDQLPIYSKGEKITPPPLHPRVEYALRRIGGFQVLHQMDVNKMPFTYRDFCEAYNLAPLAEQMSPRLEQQFGSHKILGTIKEMPKPKALESKQEARRER
jgi:hypothetical protein